MLGTCREIELATGLRNTRERSLKILKATHQDLCIEDKHSIIISTHDVGHCEISRSPVTALLGETFTGAHLTRSVTPRMVGQRFISSNSATEIRAAVLGNIRKGFTLTIAADLGAKDWAGEDKW